MARTLIKAGILGALLGGAAVLPVAAQGLAGPYLAATAADIDNDFRQAARYYVKAMAADRQNPALGQSAMVAFVDSGNFDVARNIALSLRTGDTPNVFADMVTSIAKASDGDYAGALAAFPQNADRMSPLLWGLMRAWLQLGAGDVAGAMAGFDAITQNDTFALYGRYHKAMALAYSGDLAGAADILQGTGDAPLHLDIGAILMHARILSELGRQKAAVSVLDGARNRGFRDARLTDLRDTLKSGKTVKFVRVDDPSFGVAAALVTMAEALGRDRPNRLGLFYARLAQQIRPQSGAAAMIAADILERSDQFALAEAAYASVARDSNDYRDAGIGRAEALRRSGDVEGATRVLKALSRDFPGDINVLNALGDIFRGAKNYTAAAQAYTAAIDLLDNPPAGYWVLYYARGISFEQMGRWPEAEADLRRALEMSPDRPEVLNYLGYSFLEAGTNLDEAQTMIGTAARKSPDSGYIIDSLGWMFYRLGKFSDAVAPMEKAVELLPVDPVVSDHFGDVLWMVGRKREAAFQWRRALSFAPGEDLSKRIVRKLAVGLDAVLADEASQ